MKKLAIIQTQSTLFWKSCQTISANLKQSYELLEKKGKYEIEWLSLEPAVISEVGVWANIQHYSRLAEQIRDSKPDQLIFLDHLPSPPLLLAAMEKFPGFPNVPVNFHVYGDFTYFAHDWIEFFKSRKKQNRYRLISASERQTKLIEELLMQSGPQSVVKTLFFPVDPKQYSFDAGARAKKRAQYGLKDTDRVVLYTGRLSAQKNITRMIREFAELCQSSAVKNPHFYLAGSFDDLGTPFSPATPPTGTYFHAVSQQINGLPHSVQKRIHFVGNLDSAELREFYCAADVFFSLSLHHDEDFGMSVAEALSCGLPSVLSDWGGFSSFAHPEWGGALVPTSITERGLVISSRGCQRILTQALSTPLPNDRRKQRAYSFMERFSVGRAAALLGDLIGSAFPEKVDVRSLWKLHYLLCSSRDTAVIPRSGGFYESVYRHYCGKTEAPPGTPNDDVNWVLDLIHYAEPELCSKPKPSSNDLSGYFVPMSKDYYSPTRPVFLYHGVDDSAAQRCKFWQARDGAIPLLKFFDDYTPETFGSTVLVHKDLLRLVPPHWAKSVGSYSIECTLPPLKAPDRRGLILTGCLSPGFADYDQFSRELDLLAEKIGDPSKIEILAYFSFRSALIQWARSHEDNAGRWFQAVSQRFGADVKFLTWSDLSSLRSLEGYCFHEFNQGLIIKDSFVSHHLLSIGARRALAETPQNRGQQQSVQLSPFHAVRWEPRTHFSSSSLKAAKANQLRLQAFKSLSTQLQQFENYNKVCPSWVEAYVTDCF
jgi:glycosyltransferase involved in cell wall biosynthesis